MIFKEIIMELVKALHKQSRFEIILERNIPTFNLSIDIHIVNVSIL